MKTLLLKARDFRLNLSDTDETALVGVVLAFLFMCLGGLAGFQLGKKAMSSGESIILGNATYTCAKTNELVGKDF